MENLPGDVLSNIFIRLLAKQLAQMRCVCKPWNTLLSESTFIKSHLHRSMHNNNEDILLFFQQDVSFNSIPGPLTARSSHSPHLELTNFIKLKFPVNPQHKESLGMVIGSVNGLICFCYHFNRHIVIRIWNPSLSAVVTLPPYILFNNQSYHLRFGFDPKTDDYKVVKLPLCFGEPDMVTQPQGEVYSMRKGSWEIISQRIPSHIKQIHSHNDVCVNGHLHWICVTDLEVLPRPKTIVTFDLGAMTYGEISLPDCITYDRRRCSNVLGVLGGKLCVMSHILNGECEVWVMDDDESWVKNHVFSQFDEWRTTPYRFTSHNEFLFQVDYGSRFALYDPIAAKTKIFKIKLREKFRGYIFTEYVDSLVWIAPVNPLQN